MPHFHIITTAKPWKRVKDIAWYAGFGHQAEAVIVTGPKAASYVAKYATKQNPATPKGFRRVRKSNDIAPLPPYLGVKLIPPARDEHTWEYCQRVSEQTGIDIDTLYDRWQDDAIDN